MYQALVRLPSSSDTGNGNAPRRARFDWGILARLLMRLLRAAGHFSRH